jgi:DNA-binding response OmpR family regulator
MKILIVEDDLMVADLLEESLILAGFDVCAIARNTAKAVVLARAHRPDVAIIDINLGGGGLGSSIPGLLGATWPLGILFARGTGYIDHLADANGTALILKPYSMTDMIAALAIVGDIVASGASSRPLPRGMRLLRAAAAVA